MKLLLRIAGIVFLLAALVFSFLAHEIPYQDPPPKLLEEYNTRIEKNHWLSIYSFIFGSSILFLSFFIKKKNDE